MNISDPQEFVRIAQDSNGVKNIVDTFFAKAENRIDDWHDSVLPISIYDIRIDGAGGKQTDILSKYKGKVTLIFNVAAGCGNIPQHGALEELHQMYKDEPDFNVLAVVVDDFVCHGYPEFQQGLNHYIAENNLSITAGELAKQYAEENFGTSFEFSEVTNGRWDKHTYDASYVPGKENLQEQHPLWWYLTGAHNADIQPNGVPYITETIPWSYSSELDENGTMNPEACVKVHSPLGGNFEKYLIDRTGTKVKRYANGFLLGERNINGETFPWFNETWKDDGRRDHNPKTDPMDGEIYKSFNGNGVEYPNILQRKGIEVSLEIIKKDIDYFLSE